MWQRYLLYDGLGLILLSGLVPHFRLFFMLATCILVGYLTLLAVSYLIELSRFDDKKSDRIKYKLKLLVFRNDHAYRLLSNLISRKNFFREEFHKIFDVAAEDSVSLSSNTDFIIDRFDLDTELRSFFRSFSRSLIETWYLPHVSRDEQFLNEVNYQLVLITHDIIVRFERVNKTALLSDYIQLVNQRYIDALDRNIHSALHSPPFTEINYNKKLVQIVLNKSGSNLHIGKCQFLDEFTMQIVGKNVIENIVKQLSRPNFVYFVVAYLVNKKKTREKFYSSIDESITGSMEESVIHEGSQDLDSPSFDGETPSAPVEKPAVPVNKTPSSMAVSSPPKEAVSPWIISISKTETCLEKGSGKPFTNYIIQIEYQINGVAKKKITRRRYREFVLLQRTIEENSEFRKVIRDVKGPPKYMNNPFGNMDEEFVEKRRRKMSAYLNRLSKIPKICRSREFIKFLALDENNESFFNAIKGSNDNLLVRTISGVLDKITVSKKSDDLLNMNNSLDLIAEIDKITYEYSDNDAQEKLLAKFASVSKSMNDHKDNGLLLGLKKKREERSSFAKNLVHLVSKIVAKSSDNHMHQKVMNVVEFISGSYYVEKYFEDKFEDILSTENMISYLHMIEDLVFTESERPSLNFDVETEDFYQFAFQIIIESIPESAYKLIGAKEIESIVRNFLDLFVHNQTNKHLIYTFLDFLLYNLYHEEFSF